MYTKDDFIEFFKNRFTAEFSDYCCNILRSSVTGINAVCGDPDQNDTVLDKSRKKYIEEQCRKLMRAAEIFDVLSDDDVVCEVVNVTDIIDEAVKGTSLVLGDKCSISMSSDFPHYVNSNKKILRYMIIESIRRIAAASAGKKPDIVIGASKPGKAVEILITSSVPFTEQNESSDLFTNNHLAVEELLAYRIGAKISFCEGEIRISIPDKEQGNYYEVRSRLNYFDTENYSLYELMLGDI